MTTAYLTSELDTPIPYTLAAEYEPVPYTVSPYFIEDQGGHRG